LKGFNLSKREAYKDVASKEKAERKFSKVKGVRKKRKVVSEASPRERGIKKELQREQNAKARGRNTCCQGGGEAKGGEERTKP